MYWTTLHLSSRFVDFVIFFYFRALQPPNWLAQWHCGVRVASNNKLVGFIAAVPTDVLIYETWVAHKYMQLCEIWWVIITFASLSIKNVPEQMFHTCSAGRSGWCRSNSCAFIRSCASSGWLQFWSGSSPDGSTSRASTRLSMQLLSLCRHRWAPAGSGDTGRVYSWLEGTAKPELLKFPLKNTARIIMKERPSLDFTLCFLVLRTTTASMALSPPPSLHCPF